MTRRGVDAPVFDLNTGDDLLEAESMLKDAVQRRRRIFGAAHPETLRSESALSTVRAKLAARMHA